MQFFHWIGTNHSKKSLHWKKNLNNILDCLFTTTSYSRAGLSFLSRAGRCWHKGGKRKISFCSSLKSTAIWLANQGLFWIIHRGKARCTNIFRATHDLWASNHRSISDAPSLDWSPRRSRKRPSSGADGFAERMMQTGEMHLECLLRSGQLCGITQLARASPLWRRVGVCFCSSQEHVTLLLEKRKSRVYHGASLDRWRRAKRRDHSLTGRYYNECTGGSSA